ncbi:MAG: DUF2007 domain-containing protein [bacterium]|nr:DUF2007 domain-containing protein [bacterium]
MHLLWALLISWALHILLLLYGPDLPGWIAALEYLGAWALVVRLQDNRRQQLHRSSDKVVDLHQYRADKEKKTKPQPNWVTLFRSNDFAEVGLLTSLLDSKGIETQVANRHSSALLPNLGGLPMEILVRPEAFASAQKVAQDFTQNTSES